MNAPSYSSLLQLFREPSLDYSDFVTWFWETGELDKERLTWQLEELKKKGRGRDLVLSALSRWRTVRYRPRLLHRGVGGSSSATPWLNIAVLACRPGSPAGREREYWQDRLRAERAAQPELAGPPPGDLRAAQRMATMPRPDRPAGRRDSSVRGRVPARTASGWSPIRYQRSQRGSCRAGASGWTAPESRLAPPRRREPAARSRLPQPPCRRPLARSLLAGTRRAAARIYTRHALPLRAGRDLCAQRQYPLRAEPGRAVQGREGV